MRGSGLMQPRIRRWLLTGLLVRLLVMPITAHGDLLAVYNRAYLVLGGQTVNGLGPNIFNKIHAVFLWSFKGLLPYSTMWEGFQSKTGIDFFGFVNQTAVFRELFLFKLPYLIFEVLVVWMLLKLTNSDRSERVIAFWMLNPVVIFSSYVFGRFDMITVFLLLLSLYFVRQEKPGLALFMLGIAALLRVYPVILVLPFVLILDKSAVGRIRLGLIGLLPFLVSIFVGMVQVGGQLVKGFAAMPHLSYPLKMKFALSSQDSLYIFVFIYSLIMMYLYVNPKKGFTSLVEYSFYILLLFFATSSFHPHYLIWLAPFVTFYFDRPFFLPIYGVHLIGWMILTFQFGSDLTTHLVAPLSPAFFWAVISPSQWIDRYYSAVQVIGMGRSVFSATCLIMAYLVWQRGLGRGSTEAELKESDSEMVYEGAGSS